MKKLMLASAMMMGFISFSFAQTTATKATKPVQAKMEAKKVAVQPAAKTVVAAQAAKPVAKTPVAAPAKTTDKNGTVLKKDGTPDKRYAAAKSNVPLKKDGTPDKRFKENKKP